MGTLKKADRGSATGVRPSESVKEFATDVCADYQGWHGDPIGGLAKRIATHDLQRRLGAATNAADEISNHPRFTISDAVSGRA
jgi:hypothetical protein